MSTGKISASPGGAGNFSRGGSSNASESNKKGECTMDDLNFNPSALLIVGMLIGVVYTLL